MVNKVCDSLIYSMNPSAQGKAFSSKVQGDIEGVASKTKSTLCTLFDTAVQAVEFTTEMADAAKKAPNSETEEKQFHVVPSFVENIFGEKYTETICPPEEQDQSSIMYGIVQKIAQKIISQSERKDLNLEVIIKKDESDINAYIIPGGKIVVTSGLIKQLYEDSFYQEEFEEKIAATLSYLTARATGSHQVKQAQTKGLFSLIGKVIKFVFQTFFTPEKIPVKGSAKAKLSPKGKKQRAVGKILEHTVEIGERILLKKLINSAECKAREQALNFSKSAGFEINEEDLDEVLENIFQEDETEKLNEEIEESFSKIIPQAVKLFV